ncbi:MAG: hypothetical protein PHD09_04830, partial [Candidatus Omnitrophica bacterium]|nr:hypothetical protein [Candidatus Omnitrophota bacterium]
IQIQQTVFAINARGVYLSHALEFETSRAVKGLKDFYKGKLPQITVQPATPESLKSLYEAMLFDLDGTLTDTLSGIDKSLLNRLLYFLGAGVIIGIATAQSIDEVKKYIIDQVDSDKAPVLENLVVFTARGAQAWGFDQGKNPRLLYDRSQSDLNDAQRLLVRQVITQALGSLSDDTEIRDRQALITIRLNKNKEKRDMVNATLKQLIKNNNLPYWTEYSGSSTIHVVLSGVDKGTARDYFVSRFIPAKLDHPADPAKLLIVGDRFQDSGSDRPMITKGARVVSVGGKDKTTSPEVEYYPIHGWKGTNQLLGQIMDRGRTGTLTVPGIILGFWGLSDYASSLNDPASDAFDALRKVVFIALSIGIVLLAVKPAVKCFLAYRLYRQTAHAFSFLSRQEKFIVFREIYRRVNRRSLSGIDPYQFLVEILPVLSRQISNRRILEMANSVSRLKKAKLNPLHVFKYCLPGIVAKSRDTQSFIQSLSIAERFSLALQDKHYDYHQLLKEIMPQVTTITRNIDEFNEAMLLGIALVKSGRNPSFALTKMLPEVISLTKTISEFRLSIYALQQLCLEGFEPTKFLIAALIQQNTQANIDQTLFNWQETRRKFKTGQIVFDPKNELHVNIEYTTFRELADRTLKQPHKYSFREYQEILNNFKQDRKKAHLSHTEKAEVKFAAYEAFRLRQFVLEVKKRADKLGKKVWIVPNLSYGRFAVSPIAKDLIADGAEIHYARIGSSESHENPAIVRPDLFSPGLYDRIMNEQPIIIVVDGTQHHLPRPRQKKSPRYPDAYQGYRNLIIAVNDVISCGQERAFKHLVKRDGKFIRHIRKKSDYRKLRRRFFRLYKPDTKAKRPLYTVEFWNPGRRQIMLREARKEICAAIPVEADQIYQPALIFVSSVMFDEDIPVFIRNWINREKKVRHKPAYFDDTAHIQNIIFKVDNFGVSLSDEIYTDIRREYKRIIEIYRPRLDLSAGPLDPANLPYKAVISDLDGTLADNLQPIQKLALEKLLYLLSLGVQVAVITGQSHKEMERNFISQVPAKYQGLLANLTVYPATGSQGFGFDQNGNALAVPLYDSAEARLTGQQMQAWRQIVESLLKEFALDQKVKDRKGRIIARPAELVDGGSQIIVRLRERAFLRREIKKRLERAVNVENLPIRFKEIGRTGIRMTIKGIDKSAAVKYHLSRVCKDRFGFEPKPEEVLILGNSFDEGDDDRDMMIRGAKVFSVGAKPLMRHLRAGINFYPVRDRQGGDQLLAELINLFPDKKPASPEAQSPAIRSNSFFPLPLLASGNLFDGLDLLAGFTVCCIAGISAAILIFRHKIFSRRQASRPEGNFDNQGIQSDNGRDLNKIAGQIREQYHGIKVGIIGAAAPTKEYSSNSGVELGRKLSNYLGDNGFVFTGGVSGVGVDVYRGVVDTGKGKNDRFFILLPEEIPPAKEYLDVTSDRQVNTAYFGEDMFERRIGMAKVADVLVVVNGRGGTLHEAISALEENKKVIVLNQGGAGGLLYLAKLENSVLPGLADSGLRKEHLKNIFLADISNIEKTLDLVLGRKPEATALILGDPLEKVLFSASGGNGFVLGQKAISAINSLAGVHKELFLEIDADTLIDASKDHLQLKGLGFKAAVASLLQAQVEKQIPEKLRIRLININPYLNRDQIIEVLGLDDSLLERMVSIPEIPEDYLIKSLEPYLVTNSIRIIFEDNLKFWGGKIDVLVKRGQEGEILSSLGLIIAGLAKEPEFYAILPDDLKVFLAAVKDEKGDIALDDQNKIKRLIFKPIEKTKVDTRYLDRLNKANQELEGMV